MGKGINKVILVGNLGDNPEIRYANSGAAIATLSIATSESWKDKNTGEQQEKTEWHRVVMFNRLGEIAGEYLSKGSKVYIEGKLQTRKWQDNTGADRYTTEIVANEMQMLDSRGDQANGGQQSSQPRQSPQSGSPSGAGGGQPRQQAQAQTRTPSTPPPSDDFDDDIPF